MGVDFFLEKYPQCVYISAKIHPSLLEINPLYVPDAADEDQQVLDFIKAVNNNTQEGFIPGNTVTLDESMIKSHHRDFKNTIKSQFSPIFHTSFTY